MENPPAKERSTLLTILRWFFLANLALITLVALFYAVENFRGKRAWERYRKDAEQRGATFNFYALVPPEIAPEQNAADIPLINAWFDPRMRPKGDPTLWPELFDVASGRIDRDPGWNTRWHLTDLVAWQQALATAGVKKSSTKFSFASRTPAERTNAAAAILAALEVYEPALQQLREAIKRPQMRYPVQYQTETPYSILLPHLANTKKICLLLSLRASANLALGKSDAAFQDVLMGLRLVESLGEEHFIISYLVQIANLQIMSQPVWEGMALHRWNDAQLKAIQDRLEHLDFLRGLQHAFDVERAASITTIDWIKQQRSGVRLQALSPSEGPAVPGKAGFSIASLMPRGWWDLEKVSYAHIFDAASQPIVEGLKAGTLAETPISLKGVEPLHQGMAALWHHEIMANLLLPALDKVHRKTGVAQALAGEAMVACALERARLATGSYPASLEALTPRFLTTPRRDVVTGQPFRYQVEDKSYKLYSLGWNRTDDGGEPGKVLFDDQRGDWVWSISANQFE